MFKLIKSLLFTNTSSKQTILKNTFWLTIAELINKGSVFIIIIFIADNYGTEKFGIISFIMSFVSVFIVIVDLGLTTLMVRNASKDITKIQEYIVSLSFLKLILGLLAILITLMIAGLAETSAGYLWPIFLYLLYGIINNISEFLRASFRPNEDMQHEAYLKFFNGVMFLIIMLPLISFTEDIVYTFYGFLISGLLGFIVSIIYVLKKLPINRIKVDVTIIKNALKRGFFIGLGSFFIGLYINSDQIIMGFFNQFTQLGAYSLAYRFTLIICVFTGIIFNTLLPKTANKNYISDVKNNYIKGKRLVFRYNLIFIFILELLLILVRFHISGKYSEIISIIQLLLIYNIFEPLVFWGYINLISLGKEKINLFIVMFVGIINVFANFILIPIYSYNGAIFTTILSYILYFILINQYITKLKI